MSEAPVMTIDPDNPSPLWQQAEDAIREQIARGELRPGMRLAAERVLCQQLGISRVTLRKALGRLIDEGVLTSSHGRGWFVAQGVAPRKEWPNELESFSETATRMNLEPTAVVLRAEHARATLDEAEQLGVAPGSDVYRLDRIRLLGGVPIAVDETVLSGAFPEADDVDFAEASLFGVLGAAGVAPVRADSTIEARAADGPTAERLGLDERAPVLVMRQLAVDAAERALFASSITYAGERYRLRTSFARRP
jgi:GntR family transcriptional regulator